MLPSCHAIVNLATLELRLVQLDPLKMRLRAAGDGVRAPQMATHAASRREVTAAY